MTRNDITKRILALNLPPEPVQTLLDLFDEVMAADEVRREKQRSRKRRSRIKQRAKSGGHGTVTGQSLHIVPRLPAIAASSQVLNAIIEPEPHDIIYPAPEDIFEPAESPKAKLFRVGKTILVSFGITEKRTGALIGQLLKTQNDPVRVLAAIEYARDQNVAEPVAYISAVLNKEKSHGSRYFGTRKTDSQIAFELAEQLRARERAAGIDGQADAVRSR